MEYFNEAKCRFCRWRSPSPFPVVFFILIILAIVGLVAVYVKTGKSDVSMVILVLSLAGVFIGTNIRHRSMFLFKDVEDSDVIHAHPRCPDQVGGEYRDHADRVIAGPILVLPVAGWWNRARVLNAPQGSNRCVVVIGSSYGGRTLSFVRVQSNAFTLSGPVTDIFPLLREDVTIACHLNQSREYLLARVKSQDSECRAVLWMARHRDLGQFLVALRQFLATFPRNSIAAKRGRELIDAALEQWAEPAQVERWAKSTRGVIESLSAEEHEPEAVSTAAES